MAAVARDEVTSRDIDDLDDRPPHVDLVAAAYAMPTISPPWLSSRSQSIP